jgi:hypothetical protein
LEDGRLPGKEKLQSAEVGGIDRGIGYRKSARTAVNKELVTDARGEGDRLGPGAVAGDIVDHENKAIRENNVGAGGQGAPELGEIRRFVGGVRTGQGRHSRFSEIIEKRR